jgi:adenylosuccinate synthase
MIDYADIIVDLQAGDTGKGKVAHSLADKKDEYTHIVRYNGGGNAGHTIYHNGVRYVTHFIPVGVIYGIKSIIGPGCVVNPISLETEIKELEKGGFKVRENLFIDKRVHVITRDHLIDDSEDTTIGTTKTGNGPAYTDKYNRVGLRAEECEDLQDYIIDIYEEFHGKEDVKILFEGAQGFELDIDWGDYPYVTSSHCTTAGALKNGVPPQKVRKVYGIVKAYRTYVGAKEFEKPSRIFELIRQVGSEFGATTGRSRQIDWFNVDDIIKSININGVTTLIVNKVDVLEKVNNFKLFHNGNLEMFKNKNEFQKYIITEISPECPTLNEIIFSSSPHTI